MKAYLFEVPSPLLMTSQPFISSNHMTTWIFLTIQACQQNIVGNCISIPQKWLISILCLIYTLAMCNYVNITCNKMCIVAGVTSTTHSLRLVLWPQSVQSIRMTDSLIYCIFKSTGKSKPASWFHKSGWCLNKCHLTTRAPLKAAAPHRVTLAIHIFPRKTCGEQIPSFPGRCMIRALVCRLVATESSQPCFVYGNEVPVCYKRGMKVYFWQIWVQMGL